MVTLARVVVVIVLKMEMDVLLVPLLAGLDCKTSLVKATVQFDVFSK